LVTGYGLVGQSRNRRVRGREFNMVLNSMVSNGRMDLAHQVVALQERTQFGSPLTAVTYSILLKGYGRLHDIESVHMILANAYKNLVIPDIVMANSALDAFVNCGSLDLASGIFYFILDPTPELAASSRHQNLFALNKELKPNVRTFNIYLKGLARSAALDEAVRLTGRMQNESLWDAVTTNTFASVAVRAQNFTFAERILSSYTESSQTSKGGHHPNVEAYTELLDAYAKAGHLEQAVGVMKTMKQRGVSPNVFTYTSMIGALGKAGKVEQAVSLLTFMSQTVNPTVATFNALIAGLVNSCEKEQQRMQFQEHSAGKVNSFCNRSLEEGVEDALCVFRTMVKWGIRPNGSTVSVLIQAMGKCNPPRLEEAFALVRRLESDGIVTERDINVKTSLIHTCGLARQLQHAKTVFSDLQAPDVVAVNAYMDAMCRCGANAEAIGVFHHWFGGYRNATGSDRYLEPDVVSYTIIIDSMLRKRAVSSTRKAQRSYAEMRSRGVMPDNQLIDRYVLISVEFHIMC